MDNDFSACSFAFLIVIAVAYFPVDTRVCKSHRKQLCEPIYSNQRDI